MKRQISDPITVGFVFYKETEDVLILLHFFHHLMLEDEVDQIILVANSAKPECLQQIQMHLQARSFKVCLLVQVEDNLAMARQKIVDHCRNNWLYMTDPDCRPRFENLKTLFQARDKQYFAVSGPNRPDPQKNSFYFSLQLLADTWLGNFGSSQFKSWPQPQRLSHSPTCNILYNLQRVQFSFDSRLEISGEDLDFNWRHCHDQDTHILHLPEAWIEHNHPTDLLGWAKKVFKWGLAQPLVIIRRGYWQHGLRLAPLIGLIILTFLLLSSIETGTCLLGMYFLIVLVNSFLVGLRHRTLKHLGSHLILTLITHLAYALGQFAGCWFLVRSLAREARKTPQSLSPQ